MSSCDIFVCLIAFTIIRNYVPVWVTISLLQLECKYSEDRCPARLVHSCILLPMFSPLTPTGLAQYLLLSNHYQTCFCSQPLSRVWLCDSMHCSLTDSSVCGIFQARLLESVAMPFSRGSSWPRDRILIFYVSCIGRQVLYLCPMWETTWDIQETVI